MRKEYKAKPFKKVPSKYDKERVSITKTNVGLQIAAGLLRKRDIGALRTIIEDEPADKMPTMDSPDFSRIHDPFAQVIDSSRIPVEAMFNGQKVEDKE